MPNQKYVIVVGVDFSESSQLAFKEALDVAVTHQHVTIHAVHVQLPLIEGAPMGNLGYGAGILNAKNALESYVAHAVSEYQKSNGVTPFERIVTSVRLDEPGNQLAQYAADVEADLLVVGTSDRRGVARLLMGSVAQAVSRLAPCPVLIVRPKALPAPAPVIEPPCPRCVEARRATNGAEIWCEQHRERHGHRHTYHQSDRAGAETNFPLVGRS